MPLVLFTLRTTLRPGLFSMTLLDSRFFSSALEVPFWMNIDVLEGPKRRSIHKAHNLASGLLPPIYILSLSRCQTEDFPHFSHTEDFFPFE